MAAQLEAWLTKMNNRISEIGVREWVRFEKANVYLRVGQVAYGQNSRVFAVTIANVSINQVRYQRKGTFQRMIATIRAVTRERIMVENVLEAPFADALKRHGFVEVSRGLGGIPVLMLPLEQDWKP